MPRWRSLLDSPLAAVLFVAACYGILLTAYIRREGGDVSLLVTAGTNVDARQAPRGLTVRSDVPGYDGVWFYRLASDPFSTATKTYGIQFDNPAYRRQRILYPLLVHIASLGRVEWVPAMLVAVNVAALLVLAFVAAQLSRHFGAHALWGVIAPLYPGFVTTISGDLSEIVQCMFLLSAIHAVQKRRSFIAAALLTCAVLTRETSIVLAAALLVIYAYRFIRKRAQDYGAETFAIPLAAYAAWQALIAWRFGTDTPLGSIAPKFSVPFAEYVRFLIANSSLRGISRLYFTEAAFLGAIVAIVIGAWRFASTKVTWRATWLAYLGLASTLPHNMWAEVSFVRVLADFFLISTVVILSSGRAARIAALAATAVVWYFAASHLVKYG